MTWKSPVPMMVLVLASWSVFMVFSVHMLFSVQGQAGLQASSSSPPILSSQSNSNSIVQSRSIAPLDELTDSHNKNVTCEEGFIPVHDTLLDPSLAFAEGRKIPRIIHLTSKSRCLHPDFHENVEKWRLKGHSLFFHDDQAMEKLLYRDWAEFPNLKYVLKCLLYGGAVKADIWRVLVLWEYGGIYADFDTFPNLHKFNESTITSEDDAFFVIELLGTPSQWFMAVSPRHPLMYATMLRIIWNIQKLNDIGDLPIVFTTGPGALYEGYDDFMGPHYRRPMPILAGTYYGAHGRSVRLVGSQADQNEYITRDIIKNDVEKNKVYETMGMSHLTTFGHREAKNLRNESCTWRMYRNEMKDAVRWDPKW